jgi:hypothetical protein
MIEIKPVQLREIRISSEYQQTPKRVIRYNPDAGNANTSTRYVPEAIRYSKPWPTQFYRAGDGNQDDKYPIKFQSHVPFGNYSGSDEYLGNKS